MPIKTEVKLQPHSYSRPVLVEEIDCGQLKTSPRRVRRALKHQSKHIQAGLKKFGQIAPVLVDDQNAIIYGQEFYDAARVLDWKTIRVIRVSHLSELDIRKCRLFFEKISDLNEWDEDALHLEIQEIALLDPEIELDLPGFEAAEIDLVLSTLDVEQEVDEDDIVESLRSSTPTVCRVGDLWHLREHRLAVGDALESQTYAKLMDGKRAQLTLTDPPYNVRIAGHVSGLGSAQHREFAFASGEMTGDEFPTFLTNVLRCATSVSVNGALVYVFMDWRHQPDLLTAATAAALTQINLCVWTKTNAGMGSFYRSQHELVYVGKKGTAPHLNTIQLGKYGRNRTNVWSYAGMNTFHKDRDELLAAHPTVKPVAMIADAICDSTNRGDIVLDPFAGSGTIFLAAERTGRRAYGIEIDPEYCELAIDRWERKTGRKAIHSETGLTRDELLDRRRPARKRSMPDKLKNSARRKK